MPPFFCQDFMSHGILVSYKTRAKETGWFEGNAQIDRRVLETIRSCRKVQGSEDILLATSDDGAVISMINGDLGADLIHNGRPRKGSLINKTG